MSKEKTVDAAEAEVMRRAAADFARSTGGQAPVIDATVSDVRETKPRAKRKALIAVVTGVMALVVGFMWATGRDRSPPASKNPLLAEIEALAMSGGSGEMADAPTAPSASGPAAEAEEVGEAALEAPADVAGEAEGGAAHFDLADEGAAAPQAAAATEAGPPVAELLAQIESLEAKIASLERAKAAAMTVNIEVADVLNDGVVLRDAGGRTRIAGAGERVRIVSGRLQ